MHYLVRHGTPGFLGRFSHAEPLGASHLARGVSVVVRSCRGIELGELLGRVETGFDDPFLGELLRSATPSDLSDAASRSATASQLYEEAVRLAGDFGLPLAVLDFELLFDGRHGVLHAVRLDNCDPGPLLVELGERHGIVVLLLDLTAEPEGHGDDHGCGSCGDGGCGSGGGCGDGGCGTCSAGGKAELAAYFAELRTQMERGRVSLV
ncbi:MAG: hypothetical protein U0746_15505 [Gemmataceae bacterium]